MGIERRPRKLLNFWIGPLCAGACLATGYEITHRLMILRSASSLQEPSIQLFKQQEAFPGESLSSIRMLNLQKPPVQNVQFDTNFEQIGLAKRTKNGNNNITEPQEKEMQKVLDALETSLYLPVINKSKNQESNANWSTTQNPTFPHIFSKQNLDELFNTLIKP